MPSDAPAIRLMPASDAAAVGEVPVEPTWTAPTESEALFPPPTWTAPIESDAVFVPPVPTFVGALTEALFPATLTDADGDELTGLAWTAPAESEDVLPPPAWTVPTELEAVLSPVPETDVGAETLAEVAGAEAVTDGSTVVDPTCTVPIELSATLSAAAVLAPMRAAHTTASVAMSWRSMLMSPSLRVVAAGPTGGASSCGCAA
jgi:hypothetical protein